MQLYIYDNGMQFSMDQIILEPELAQNTLDAWGQSWSLKFNSGSADLLSAIVAYDTKMHLLRETYFCGLTLTISFRIMSNFWIGLLRP